MKKLFVPTLLLGLASLAACGTVGTYEFNNMFVGQTLVLRRDHTFKFSYSPDTIGDEFIAKGTWSKDGTTIVTSVTAFEGPGKPFLGEVTRWRKTFRGVTAEDDNDLLEKKCCF
jgi:hypothetical protein